MRKKIDFEAWEKTDEGKATLIYRDLPKVTPENLAKAIEDGLIPKKDLEDGATYFGTCRNASQAVWHADKQRFTYLRYKFGSEYPEDIVHPEDDEGADIFVAVKKL